MKKETKNCQNCKKDFIIESDDFSFYQKIKVPPPTFCPECRLQRRMSWRNDWHLFKKKDFLTSKEIFSFIPEESPVRIYDRDYWWTDKWDPMEYGQEYDFSKPFFEQFRELMRKVPLPSTSMESVVNCQYCTNATSIKNCYLVRGATFTEDSSYLIWDHASRECFDSHMTSKCELSYGNVNSIACYRTFFSVDCESCHEMILCKDCVGCNSCFGSIALRNKSYCIFNKQYTKEEYQKKLAEFNLGSYASFQKMKDQAHRHWLSYPQKYIHGYHNVDVSGDYVYESKNAKKCFRVRMVEDSKFVQNITNGPVKDCYDYSNFGNGAELIYESLIVGTGAYNVKFSHQCFPDIKDSAYSLFCHNVSDVFGCISLRGKKHCILNKQYTKDEYERLVPKIIEHMKGTKEYGEFFPANLSYLPYKATAACEFFPLSEKDAKERGFNWYETGRQEYQTNLNSEDIPDNIQDVEEKILDQIIKCSHGGFCEHECTNAFRVIKKELNYCKQVNIPLPRLCTNCRHHERLALRNSPSLYVRNCMCDKNNHNNHERKCEVQFETSYSPDRPEIVYCEKCYQQEVY